MPGRPPAGWYPNPQRSTVLRWWDGAGWTGWVSDGGGVWEERPPAGHQQLDALRFVREVFLPEARRRGVVTEPQLHGLVLLTAELGAQGQQLGAGPEPVLSAPAESVEPATSAGYGIADLLGTATHSAATPVTSRPPRVPAEPGRAARWWADLRQRLDLDLTVQGLAYLGVLLLFVGVFGLVAFAFGDVAPGMRPVAELAVAVVPFVGARLLARSGARFVARAMVAVGGLLLALMLVTSMVDGAPFPPDQHGVALPVAGALALAALAGGYVLLGRRRPGTALVSVVAPVLWLLAAMAAVGLGRPVPAGEEVAVPGAGQIAVVALAVLATTALGRTWARRDGPASGLRARLAEGALAAAQPGAVVVGVLATVAGLVEGWPVLPFVVTGLALAVVPRLAGRASAASADLVLVLTWLVVVVRLAATDVGAPLLSASHPGVVGQPGLPVLVPIALVLGTLLGELLVRRAAGARSGLGGTVLVWALPVVGLLALSDGWWAVGALALLTVWASWGRARPGSVRTLGAGLDVAAAGAPLLMLGAAAGRLAAPSTLVLAAGLVLAATPLARGWLHRPGTVDLWRWWWGVVGALTLVASMVGTAGGWLTHDAGWSRAAVPGTAVVLLLALVLGPLRRTTVVLVATPLVWWAWLAAAAALEVDVVLRAGVLALLGLGAVLLGGRPGAPDDALGRRWWGVLGLAGHVTGLVAVLVALDPTRAAQAPHLFGQPASLVALAVVVVVGTLGWLVTAVASDRPSPAAGNDSAVEHAASVTHGTAVQNRSAVVELIDRLGPVGRYLPWVVALTGSVLSAVLVLHVTGTVPVDHPWWAVVLTGAGLVLAALTRLLRSGRVRTVLPWLGYGLVLLGVVTSTEGWPTAVALAAVVVQSVVAQAALTRRRHPVPVWTAWIAITPLAVVVARQLLGSIPAGEVLVAAALVAVGGLLAVGAYLADRARPSDPRALPRSAAAVPPAVLGAGQLVLGVLVTLTALDPHPAGVVLAVAAVLVAGIAALTGVGPSGTIAVLLAWLALHGLLGPDHPGAWAHVATALVMAGAAQGLTARQQRRAREQPGMGWARWDVPLAVGAILPALVATATARPDERIGVLLVVGAAVVVAAISLRHRRILSETLGWVGTALVLGATVDAGPWWTVLGLATLSAAHTGLAAVHERGGVHEQGTIHEQSAMRTVRQWIGAVAAAAAWCLVPAAAGWDAQRASEATAVVGAAGLLAAVLVVRAVGRGRSWLTPWGGLAAALAVGAAVGVSVDPQSVAAWWSPHPGVVMSTPVTGPVLTTWWHTGAWVLLTVAAAVLARVTPWNWWREVAGATAVVGLLVGMGSADLPAGARVLVLVAMSCAAAVGAVLLQRVGSPWARAVAAVGVVAVALGAGVLAGGALQPAGTPGSVAAGGDPSATGSLVAAVLAAAAVQSAALGVAWRVLGLRLTAPALAWVAWAWYAAQSLGANPVWFTVPVGVALLVVVTVWRGDRRDRGLPVADRGVVGMELAGIGFLVVSSFVAALTVSVLHALAAAGLGVLITGWGVVTRVRRRLLAGGVVVLSGVALAVVVPLVALLPSVGQAGMWVLVAVLGLAVVLAATFLERGRSTVRGGRTRLVEATEGWE